jgi:hypothetical protein
MQGLSEREKGLLAVLLERLLGSNGLQQILGTAGLQGLLGGGQQDQQGQQGQQEQLMRHIQQLLQQQGH